VWSARRGSRIANLCRIVVASRAVLDAGRARVRIDRPPARSLAEERGILDDSKRSNKLQNVYSATSGSVTLPGSSVSTAPGEMTVVRMLYDFTSCRSASEMTRTPYLERFADRVHLMRESSHERLLERPHDQGARRPGPRDA
jgi:hypothetical protein